MNNSLAELETRQAEGMIHIDTVRDNLVGLLLGWKTALQAFPRPLKTQWT